MDAIGLIEVLLEAMYRCTIHLPGRDDFFGRGAVLAIFLERIEPVGLIEQYGVGPVEINKLEVLFVLAGQLLEPGLLTLRNDQQGAGARIFVVGLPQDFNEIAGPIVYGVAEDILPCKIFHLQ